MAIKWKKCRKRQSLLNRAGFLLWRKGCPLIENNNFNFKRYESDLKEIHERIDRRKDEIEQVDKEAKGRNKELRDELKEQYILTNGIDNKLDTIVKNAQKAEERAGKQTDRAQNQMWALILGILTLLLGALVNAYI